MAEKLQNQPLKEAIFELHWDDKAIPVEEGTQPRKFVIAQNSIERQEVDPYYKVFLKRLTNELNDKHHLPLLTAQLPEDIAGHVVQHQFWSGAPQEWPVIQVGPGVLTFNDAADYHWDSFYKNSVGIVDLFHKTHPSRDSVHLTKLSLKYSNMIEVDFRNENLFKFLSERMHTRVSYTDDLFDGNNISKQPVGFGLRTSFLSDDLPGAVTISIQTGTTKDVEFGLLWENHVLSSGSHVPQAQSDIADWIVRAHEIAEHCFRSLTSGDLERRFRGD